MRGTTSTAGPGAPVGWLDGPSDGAGLQASDPLGWPAVPRGTDVVVVPGAGDLRRVQVTDVDGSGPAAAPDGGTAVLPEPTADGSPEDAAEADPGAGPASGTDVRPTVDAHGGAGADRPVVVAAVAAAVEVPPADLDPGPVVGVDRTVAPVDVDLAEDDARRAELAESLPQVDDSTPLGRQVAEDARRRIALSGRPIAPPPRTRLLTVANQKGGVGKTTTTVNVAAALAQAGLRVVVLDSDPQGNASTALGVAHHSDVVGLYDVLVDDVPLEDVLQPCPDVPGLLCAPATIDLAGAEIELVSMVARETRLRGAVQGYLDRLRAAGEPVPDYVFVDCPPSLGLLTLNAFVCAEEVLIPIQCEYYALEGLSQLLKNIAMITKHLNPGLHVSSILLTMYDARTRLAAQVAEEVREHFPASVLATTVPRSVRVSEAPSYGQTVMTYDPGSTGALSYLAAAREIAERGPRPEAG